MVVTLFSFFLRERPFGKFAQASHFFEKSRGAEGRLGFRRAGQVRPLPAGARSGRIRFFKDRIETGLMNPCARWSAAHTSSRRLTIAGGLSRTSRASPTPGFPGSGRPSKSLRRNAAANSVHRLLQAANIGSSEEGFTPADRQSGFIYECYDTRG